MPLLFIDLLGVKFRWVSGGRSTAEEAFEHFRTLVAWGINEECPAAIICGTVESDCAAIDCRDASTALRIAKRIYLKGFRETERDVKTRYWVRGVIIPRSTHDAFRTPTAFRERANVDLIRYSGDLLDAINIEKCGFKGMILLIAEELERPK